MKAFIKGAFIVVGSTTIALLLYYNLFGYKDNVGGVVTAVRNSEKPIAQQFYNYGVVPSNSWDKEGGILTGKDYLKRADVEKSWSVSN